MLKENQLMQQEQIRECYEFLNITRVETVENRKLLKRLYREIFQLNACFTVLSTETIMLTYHKNFILIILQLRGKIAALQDGLTPVQFNP